MLFRSEDCVDAIVIAANIVTSLQTVVSRSVSPHSSSVISIGIINGGSRFNIIADEVLMEGTCRTLDSAVRNELSKLIERTAKGVAQALGGGCEVEYYMGYPPTVNNHDLFPLVYGAMKESLGDSARIAEHSSLGAEDFAYYCEQLPGAYLWLGAQPPGQPFYPLHNGAFFPDETALPHGIEILVRSALNFLNA